ncbi:Rubrerythrin [Paucidesulfovibrio gracilis DSM 16080]|uniref:Rubrerythrin n=1 Tax=Paucidesulfovibrio gracilis DSM 16080 TaxID=1121449 RepID=A0A1T4XR04_9BACT|nr:rubrerythrin family protein [Paucidesulfovibrio gracilis]SKA91515.1 Rubrerythrin [Paucidesulfovibrio gracilis DSM 16080]
MQGNGIQRLAEAFINESASAARCEVAALRARAEGRPQAARLLNALAVAQKVHADKALMILRGKLGDTDANLDELLEGLDQSATHYQEALTCLECATGPANGFLDQFRRTARNHAGLVRQVDERAPSAYQVCTVCGFVARENAPERCPVCDAVPERFACVD